MAQLNRVVICGLEKIVGSKLKKSEDETSSKFLFLVARGDATKPSFYWLPSSDPKQHNGLCWCVVSAMMVIITSFVVENHKINSRNVAFVLQNHWMTLQCIMATDEPDSKQCCTPSYTLDCLLHTLTSKPNLGG